MNNHIAFGESACIWCSALGESGCIWCILLHFKFDDIFVAITLPGKKASSLFKTRGLNKLYRISIMQGLQHISNFLFIYTASLSLDVIHIYYVTVEQRRKVSFSHLAGARVIIRVSDHQYWWLAGGYDLEIEHS